MSKSTLFTIMLINIKKRNRDEKFCLSMSPCQ